MMQKIILLVVRVDEHTPKSDGFYETICYDPKAGMPWDSVIEHVRHSAAKWVLLLYSNEELGLWNSTICAYHPQYHRLFRKDYFLRFSSLSDTIKNSQAIFKVITHEMDGAVEEWVQNRAVYYMDKGDWKNAENLLMKRMAKITNADLYFLLSKVFYGTHRFVEAVQTIEKAIELHDEKDDVHIADLLLLQGNIAATLGRLDQGGAAYRASFDRNQRVEPLLSLGELLMRQGRNDEEIAQELAAFVQDTGLVIDTMYQLGAYNISMKLIQESKLDTRKFECLIMTGQIGQAIDSVRDFGEMNKDRVLDLVLCFLSENKVPSYRQFKTLETHEEGSLFIDLLSQDHLPQDDQIRSLLIDRALELRLLNVAEKLIQGDSLLFGKRLFQKGYVMRSANYLIEALAQQKLDHEGYRYLGEILYHQGKYSEAASFFDYLLNHSPTDAALRTALILANLRQSEQLLSEALNLFPSSTFLKEEQGKVGKNIALLEQTRAMTQWEGKEKRNYHA